MFCPSCGNFVQEGSLACPNCGSEMPVEDSPANTSDSNSTNSANNSGNYNNYNGGSYSGSARPVNPGSNPNKSNKGLIIATLIGVAALILTAVFCSLMISNSSGKCDGTYVYSESYEGQDYTFEIVISKGKFEYNMTSPMKLTIAEGSTDTVGSIITFKSDDMDNFAGTYNKSKKTLTFEGDSSADTMVFKKTS